MNNSWPTLALNDWKDTRDAVHAYAKIIGKIRLAYTPKQKHWWHITLHVLPDGLSTTAIPSSSSEGSASFEINLNIPLSSVQLVQSDGTVHALPITGQSEKAFLKQILDQLASIGLKPKIDTTKFSSDKKYQYDSKKASRFWQALTQIDLLFREFKGSLRQETSPVQIFPHHFDLSFNWFSGRLVPGKDPKNEEESDQSLTFGFSTGDEGIAEPYFYATAYPAPKNWDQLKRPDGVELFNKSWVGYLLRYDRLIQSANPKELLKTYLSKVHDHGSSLMR